MPELNITAIPAFSDNYIWLIRTGGKSCAVVDPGDAQPVMEVLEEQGLDLKYILLTHHHPDHVGGMPELKRHTHAVVFGPADQRINGVDHHVGEGDLVKLDALGLEFDVLEVPGHTTSHIVFTGHDCLFCGDTLFSVGCGRIFEGTAQDMQDSLDKISDLSPETWIYCGHEYTLPNCKFALEVEPGNVDLQKKLDKVRELRDQGECTLPSQLKEEFMLNPFLRSRVHSVIHAAQNRQASATSGASTLGVIRQWKDQW